MIARFAVSAARALVRTAGRRVEYVRGELTAALRAVPGSTPFRIETDQRFNTLVRSSDWLLLRDGPVETDSGTSTFAELFGEPRRGDRIREIRAGERFTYELLSVADEPEWRPAGTEGGLLRLHTKLVKREEVA